MIVIRCDRCGAEAAQGECHMRLDRSYGCDTEETYVYQFHGAELPSNWRRVVTMALPERSMRKAYEVCADCAAATERVLCGG